MSEIRFVIDFSGFNVYNVDIDAGIVDSEEGP